MKNKIIILLLIIICSWMPLSCDNGLLDKVNPNSISTITFWRNAEDVELAVNGMYHPLTSVFFWGRVMHTGALLRSDEFNIRPGGTNTQMSLFAGGAGVRHSDNPWIHAYKTIFRANSILENVNETNVPDQVTRQGFLGQAYFMRAFAYWYLVNLYGNVQPGQEGGIPLVVKTPDPTSNEELFPGQAPALDVWNQIIADLSEAENLLPETWEPDDKGRPTTWSASALKGKSYLYKSGLFGTNEYNQAELSLLRVVNNSPHDLLPGDQFQDNFTEDNENNIESLFELQMHPTGLGSFAWGVDQPNTGSQAHFIIEYAPPSITPDNGHIINPWVKNLFEANNEVIRRNASLAYDYPGSIVNVTETFTQGLAEDITLVADLVASNPENTGLEPVFSRKYAGLELPRGETGFLGENYGPNWRIIRYADVLLMLAESLNEQNRPGEAEIYLNLVRERAEVATLSGLDQNEMRQAIIDERTLELLGEGHRFFDLLRWGLAENYLGSTSAHSGPHPRSIAGGGSVSFFVSGRHELIPIPVQEIDANPNLKQNPGY